MLPSTSLKTIWYDAI